MQILPIIFPYQKGNFSFKERESVQDHKTMQWLSKINYVDGLWSQIQCSLWMGGGGKSPPPLALQVGGKSPWGEKSPPIWHCEGGEKSPPGKISLPLKNIFTKSAWTFFTCTAHEFDFNPTLLHSYILNLERSQTSKNMFLTIKIEKI